MTGLGRRLREAREARGLSIEQVERDTRIGRHYIEALEAEDFAAFPADVYARGFLRSYASYLGLDPAEAVAAMPREEPEEAETPRPRRARPASTRRPRAPSVSASMPALLLGSDAAPIIGIIVLLLAAFVVGRVAGSGPDPFVPSSTGAVSPSAAPGGPSAPAATGRMPNLIGTSIDDARARLAAMNVEPFVIAVPSTAAPAGQVLGQSPPAGASIGHAIVTLVVSRSQ